MPDVKARKATGPKKANPAAHAEPLQDEPLPAELRAVPDPEPEPVAEPETLPEGAVRVPLGDGSVVVLNREDWPSSANEDFYAGRYRTWAMKVLADEGSKDFWEAMDPTNRQVNDFCGHMSAAFGDHLADNRATRRALMRLAT